MNHPLVLFRYCPVCGSEHFVIHNEKSRHCNDCGFTYYSNPSAASVAFIVNDNDELLVVRRAKEPAKGTLDLPGGFCDMYETVEEGVAREVMEETGLAVTKAHYLFAIPNLYLYSGMTIHTMDMFFRCNVADTDNAHAADDAAECMWIPIKEVNPKDFGLTSISKGVKKFLESQESK